MKKLYFIIVSIMVLLPMKIIIAGDFPKAYYNEKKLVVLENEFLRFEIDPLHGGRISSFIDKRDGDERVVPGRVEGLCFDQFYEQDEATLSGQWNIKYAQPYDAEIVESNAKQSVVKVGRLSIPSEREVLNENYSDLYIERIFTLKPAQPVLKIDVRITNHSNEGRRPAYWMRSGYVIGKDRRNEQYLRPSRRGIQIGGPDYSATDQMVRDPAYGWTATLDTLAHAGVVWLMDESRLMMFYNSTAAVTGKQIDDFANKYGVDPLWIWDNASSSAVTAEWYYHRAFIPPGEFWLTSVQMLSLQGINSISHACQYFVADLTIPEFGRKGTIGISLMQSNQPVNELKISGELIDSDSPNKSTSLGTIQSGVLTVKPVTISFPYKLQIPQHAVLRFHVNGRTAEGYQFSELFEFVDNPDGKELSYRLPAPNPTFHYQPGAHGLKPEGKRRVLFLEGLAYERWDLIESLKKIGAEIREVEFMKRRITTAVRYFPVTLKEALRYEMIIMAAIDANALSFEGCQILRDYVNNGGSLFVLGGLYSWGTGRFQEMGLDDFLPLSIITTFDIKEGNNYRVIPDEKQFKDILQNLSSASFSDSDWGKVNWFHQLKAKAQAKVLLHLGDFPLLAVSSPGNGKIACMAGTTLGTAKPNDKSFWNQSGWIKTKDQLLKWLLSIN